MVPNKQPDDGIFASRTGWSRMATRRSILRRLFFLRRQDSEFIIHGLFVDDMMHVPTCDKLRDKFLTLYQKDIDITGGGLMETFLGMGVKQPGKVIKLHLHSNIQRS